MPLKKYERTIVEAIKASPKVKVYATLEDGNDVVVTSSDKKFEHDIALAVQGLFGRMNEKWSSASEAGV